MSYRAAVSQASARPERFVWGGPSRRHPAHDCCTATPNRGPCPARMSPPDLAALEREAFTKGYAQGERAGAEAGASAGRGDAAAAWRRRSTTWQALRADLIRRTEREMVELSLAIARKVLQREVSLDHDLLMAMARVALDRLADIATASIRLHPDDYAGVMLGRGPSAVSTHGVAIVADPSVRRGGCVVQSEFGSVDIGVETQIDELAQALLRRRETGRSRAGGLRDDAAA